jgi:hypothetical protein
MSILIAPIGIKTDHVKTWLVEVSFDATILYLIHSEKSPKYDFPKIAKDLEKDIKKSNSRIEIKKRVITDSFSIEPTMDVIADIIDYEKNQDPTLPNNRFVINITGGTNAIAAAAMLSATFFGTRAHYIKEPQKDDPRGTQYVEELPIKPMGIAKMNDSQLEILKIIANNEFKIENTPSNLEVETTKGIITRQKLLELGNELREKSKKKSKSKVKKLTPTTLSGITDKLVAGGLIERIQYVEFYQLPNSKKYDEHKNHPDRLDAKSNPPRVLYTEKMRAFGQEELIVKNAKWPLPLTQDNNGVTYKITKLGKSMSRYAYLFNDPHSLN